MSTKRTDIHRPEVMVAADYCYLASSFGYREEDLISGEDVTVIEWGGTDEWTALGEPEKSTAPHARVGHCDHCGAVHKYQTILLHLPTGQILSVGHTCATFRFNRPDFGKQVAAAARKMELLHAANQKEREAISGMTDICVSAYFWGKSDECSNRVAADIAAKVRKYGPLSEKQQNFLVSLYAKHLEQERALETGDIQPCPAGKVTITGTVLSVKREVDAFKSDRWGTVYKFKMLVRSDDGFKVWGTVPSALVDNWQAEVSQQAEPEIQPNCRVRFVATVEPSAKDRAFGFFSRPSKAVLLGALAI